VEAGGGGDVRRKQRLKIGAWCIISAFREGK